jgi:hypothetical protein
VFLSPLVQIAIAATNNLFLFSKPGQSSSSTPSSGDPQTLGHEHMIARDMIGGNGRSHEKNRVCSPCLQKSVSLSLARVLVSARTDRDRSDQQPVPLLQARPPQTLGHEHMIARDMIGGNGRSHEKNRVCSPCLPYAKKSVSLSLARVLVSARTDRDRSDQQPVPLLQASHGT